MRILFPKGEQNKFINKILSFISVSGAAKLCHLSERTIRDWRREKFLPHKDAIIKLCEKTKISFPVGVELKDNYWYTANGSASGGLACFKKYGYIGGDPEYRKKKWYEWWGNKGKFMNNNPLFRRKPINKPRKSKELAEFIGIMLGDGGITVRAKQIQITLNNRDDKKYIKFVCCLINKLFLKKPSVYKCKYAVASKISVSNMDLIDYLIKLGLKTGNKIKQQVDIPDWIKSNKSYSIACARGLVDTDGCVFNHRYCVNNKFYNYKKLSFTSYSKPLRYSVFKIMKDNGLNPRLAANRDIRLDSIKDMQKYFRIIGSHNPKHLEKYKN